MNEDLYKKSGLSITKLSRDLISRPIDSKLPSLNDYASNLGVSRGMIQRGLIFLEENNCITLNKNHGSATYLTSKNLANLCIYTGWDLITINMPIPGTSFLQSLATALYNQNSTFPIPLAMVYVTGSENRLHYLQKNIYDVVIMSLASARLYCEKYDFLAEPLVLSQCTYAGEFRAFFADPTHTTLQDGMKVAADPSSLDHFLLTQEMCKDKNVTIVKTPFLTLANTLKTHQADVVFHRYEEPFLQFDYLNPQPIECTAFSKTEATTPTLLFNKSNYGMREFFTTYLNIQAMQHIQKGVLTGTIEPGFY